MLKQNNIPDIIQLGAQQHRPLVEGMIHVYVMPIEDLLRIEAELLAYINAMKRRGPTALSVTMMAGIIDAFAGCYVNFWHSI